MKNIILLIIFLSNWSFVWGQIVEKPESIIVEDKQDLEVLLSCCCKQDAFYEGG